MPLTFRALGEFRHFTSSFGSNKTDGLLDHTNQMCEIGTCHY